MALRDPTADTEPDFEDISWEVPRNAMVNEGKTPEEAIEALRRSWRILHEKNLAAWDEHLRQQQEDLERDGNSGNGAMADTPDSPTPMDDEPEWLESTPSFIDIRPARHIMKRLKKKEYVKLWHFTIQGCRDAALTDLTTPDDTFGLVNTNDGLRLQTVGASTISSKITRDENLSWEQMSEGKSRLLDCMSTSGWSNREVGELAKFFVKLDLHPIRSQEYGSQTVLRYQDRVRQDWVRSINEKKPYPIGSINDELMKEYQRQILVELQARNIVSAFIAPNEKRNRTLTISPRTTRASHSPHHHSYRTCTASPIPTPSHAPAPLHCFCTASLAPAPLHMHLHLVSTIPPCPPPHMPHIRTPSHINDSPHYRPCRTT